LSPAIPEFAYRHRGQLVAVPLVWAAICSWHEYENGPVTWAAAGIVFLIGVALRVWSQQHLHYRLRAKTNLTVTGPYALVRNPVYIANTLICIALTLASEVLWLLPVTILTCAIVYTLVVRYEEGKLAERYGDAYIAYQRCVSRWAVRWPNGLKARWTRDHLRASLAAEAHNMLLMIPLLLKELLSR